MGGDEAGVRSEYNQNVLDVMAMGAQVFNLSTQEVKEGGFLKSFGQLGLYYVFQARVTQWDPISKAKTKSKQQATKMIGWGCILVVEHCTYLIFIKAAFGSIPQN